MPENDNCVDYQFHAQITGSTYLVIHQFDSRTFLDKGPQYHYIKISSFSPSSDYQSAIVSTNFVSLKFFWRIERFFLSCNIFYADLLPPMRIHANLNLYCSF